MCCRCVTAPLHYSILSTAFNVPLSLSPHCRDTTDMGVTTGLPAFKEQGKNKPSKKPRNSCQGRKAEIATPMRASSASQALLWAHLYLFPCSLLWCGTWRKERSKNQLPMSVTGTPYSRAEMAVHFPVPFCPALSLIFGRRYLPSLSLNLRILAVISIRKESNSVLFHSWNTWKRRKSIYIYIRTPICCISVIFFNWLMYVLCLLDYNAQRFTSSFQVR